MATGSVRRERVPLTTLLAARDAPAASWGVRAARVHPRATDE
jgi:hypothetical protein